ncbi:MAG: hypothetical protein HC837_15175 [Chloroflexaceae bacterium]|nr:hypothetical protein [Chloroflexaceae bacterium]
MQRLTACFGTPWKRVLGAARCAPTGVHDSMAKRKLVSRPACGPRAVVPTTVTPISPCGRGVGGEGLRTAI